MSSSVAPGEILHSKYRVDSKVDGSDQAFAATTVQGGAGVLVFGLTVAEVAALERGKGVDHMHLSRLLEVIDVGGAQFGVAEHLTGLTLAERLADVGKKEPVDAVRFALRIADALSCLHEAGACHGSVHARGILIQVEGRAPPVLGYFPSKDSAYRSPDRGADGPPTEADDAWAAAALLHLMLTGKPPPSAGYAAESDLSDAGVTDAALSAALAHALNQDPEARSRDVRPLKRELARWFVEHAGDEPPTPGPHSSSPPPLPASTRGSSSPSTSPGARSRPAPAQPQKSLWRKILPLALGGLLAGLVGAWAFNLVRPKPTLIVTNKAVKTLAAAPATATAKPINLGDVPVTGESATVTTAGDKLSSCAMAYLPKGTFAKAPDFSGMCDETDPRSGADKLRVAVVGSAPKDGGATDAMKIFARIGWYDMAAFAVVRSGCCPDAKPLTLPAPSKTCGAMDEALREIGQEVVAMHGAEEALKKYTAAIHCEVNLGRGPIYRKRERPVGGEDSAFLELVKAIQAP